MQINNTEKLFDLSNKLSVVIGGGGYLCSAMAKGLLSAGSDLVILDLRLEKAKLVSDELNNLPNSNVLYSAVDVTRKKSIIEAKNFILDNHPKIDILVNGAGINDASPFFDIELDTWHEVMNSQITGTMLACQVFGSQMVSQGNGSIINISSASAGPPLSKAFAYSVAKEGIKNLTMNLAREWAKSGVRVNAIRPGFFPTEWNRKNFITPERENDILNHTPMERYGHPDELIGATIWLSSDSASFVTGAEITIDGGFSCMTI